MAAIIKLPPEVLQEVFSYMHDGLGTPPFPTFTSRQPSLGQYESKAVNLRKNLSSLRRVNRLFRQVANPLLFQHVVICTSNVKSSSGISGTMRLQQLAREPELREMVRRLEICGVYSGGSSSYYPTFEQKDHDLKYLGRLAVVIHSTLPRFTGLKILKLDFQNIPYEYKRDSDLPALRKCCWVQDTANMFESLATAMYRSGLDKLEELDLSLPLAYDFGHFLDIGDEPKLYSARAFFQQLKRLKVCYNNSAEQGRSLEFRAHQRNQDYDKNVRQLISLGVNLESLAVAGPGNDLLKLDSTALASLEPKSLDLKCLAITGEALSDLFNRSKKLRKVALTRIYLRSGTWEDVLKPLSLSNITSFHIETCVYEREGESAEFIPLHRREQTEVDAGYIETSRAGDIESCKSVFARVHENMRQVHGSSYDTTVVEARRQAKHMDRVRRRATLRNHFLDFEGSTSDDDWDTTSSMDEVIDTLENLLPHDDSDDSEDDDSSDGSSDDDSSDEDDSSI
ncbi:hypothetical protein QYS62_011212 [Fusarium acuminatum]|uniref:F-box domain-containing protein n=1 Tax=Fusarium acuminatum TaxID=5515 RepID=A0ABZ2XA48_9HYPO